MIIRKGLTHLYPTSKPSLAYLYEQFEIPYLSAWVSMPSLLAQPTCPPLTMHLPGTQHTPFTGGCSLSASPLYSLPPSWLCSYSFFHPSKSWLSSSLKSNATPSRNKAFTDFSLSTSTSPYSTSLWSFLYFSMWNQPLCISYISM